MKLVLCLLPLIGIVFGATSAAENWITYEGKAGPGRGKHIVFLTGDEEYRSEEGLPQLAKILARRHGFKCTVLFPSTRRPVRSIRTRETTSPASRRSTPRTFV